MKVLVLSCSTGEGHNSAGNAVLEYFTNKNVPCDMINAFSFVSDMTAKVLSHGHVFVYRNMPRLFGAGYRLEEKYPPKSFYKKMAKGAPGLYDFIQSGGYDTVVCSHIFAAMMLTECKRQFAADVLAYLLITDYTCSPGVNMLDMDAYFIPHELLCAKFADNGVDTARVVPSGIPVSQRFFSKKPKELSRRELNISENADVVLLSSGSMGCGPMDELARCLLRSLSSNAQLCVVCGSNRRLYAELEPLTKDKRLSLAGFTPKMFDYMNSADVYITKAGGLSTTEAVTVGVPLIFMDAVPGCESYNLSFMTENGCAVTADSVEGIAALTCDILKDKEKALKVFLKGREKIVKNGAENVYNYIIGRHGR
jgi:processive 1,2-diacylglycerol beta-glucosyltransferase